MPKSTPTCNSILNLMYRAVAWTGVADNAASSPYTIVYVGLHTGNLTAATNSQLENETVYTNYVRKDIARTTGGWTAPSGGAVSNAALTQFLACGATGAALSHVSTGTNASGAGNVWHYGALNATIDVGNGIQPQFGAGALVIQET